MKRTPWEGYLALSAAAAIWGGLYVVSKVVLDFIPPFTLVWIRYLIAFAVLRTIVGRLGLSQPLSKDWRTFMTIGLIGYTVSIGCQFIGTRLSSAHMGSVLTAASPAFMVFFARRMLGEAVTTRKLFSTLLATVGVLVIVGLDHGTGPAGSGMIGNFFLVGAAVTWAILSVLARRASATYSPLIITTHAIFWGWLFTTPAMLIELHYLPVSGLDRPTVWLAILYISIISTAGAFFLWNKGMQLVEAGIGSVFFFLQPVVGSLLGWLILGETLAPSFLAGSGLVLGGVMLASLPGIPSRTRH
jgi:drug/metabolite transporter (DMT)-like permease